MEEWFKKRGKIFSGFRYLRCFDVILLVKKKLSNLVCNIEKESEVKLKVYFFVKITFIRLFKVERES